MEILIACLIATYVVKNGVIDAAYAVRGKPSPRQELARRLIEGRGERAAARDRSTGRVSPFRRYMGQLWNDSWVEARGRHDRRLERRRSRREAQQSGLRPRGALRRYASGMKDDAWSAWDRRWDTAQNRRRERQLHGQADAFAAALIAAAESRAPQAAPSVERSTSAGSGDPTGDAPPTPPRREITEAEPVSHDSVDENVGGTASPPELATIHPFHPTAQEGPDMAATATGETNTLSQTLGMIHAWEAQTQAAVTSLETSIASLQGSEVGPSVTGPLGQAQEAFGQALAAFRAAKDALQPSTQIGDMYNANPDAGDKAYVSG